MNNGVSIIICCYNSSTRIATTLEHLAKQIVSSSIPWEVILVDNNCTDDTVVVAQETWASYSSQTPLIIEKEPNPGLSYARKKGLSKVQFDTIIFCDDDNWLNPQYVQIAFELIQSNPKIGVIGGWGTPEWEVTPPEWLLYYAGCYATGPQGAYIGESISIQQVYGAGMVIRRSAIEHLDTIGFEGFLTGRKGRKMLAGDDHELCYAINLCGYEIFYDEHLKFKHFIPNYRMTKEYIVNLLKGFSRSSIVLGLYKRRIQSKDQQEFIIKSSFGYALVLAIRWKIKTILKCVYQFIFKPEKRLMIIYSDFYSFLLLCVNPFYYNQMRKKIKQIWVFNDPEFLNPLE